VSPTNLCAVAVLKESRGAVRPSFDDADDSASTDAAEYALSSS